MRKGSAGILPAFGVPATAGGKIMTGTVMPLILYLEILYLQVSAGRPAAGGLLKNGDRKNDRS